MKFIISVIIIAVLSLVAGNYLPWWSIAVIAFAVAWMVGMRPFASFIAGFAGVFMLWTILAWNINSANNGILAARVGQLFGIGSATVLIVVTGIVGGLVAGLAALSGAYVRKK